MREHGQAMKDQKQELSADMKIQDDRVTEQLTRMYSTPEDKKVCLTEVAITRMVEQWIAN